LYVFLYFPYGDKKPAKKDIIIVNIDEGLSSQLAGLAQYTYDLYLSNNKGTVTIKKYLESIDAEDASISHLVALITDLGVHESRISIKSEILTLEQPYFTLSVTAGPEVQ